MDRPLIGANPWLAELARQLDGVSADALGMLARAGSTELELQPVIEARRGFHSRLLGAPRSHWAAWADAMAAARPALLRAGRGWALWKALAHVDLSGLRFDQEADFSGRTFPDQLSLSGALFDRDVFFTGIGVEGDADLSDALMARDCWFDQVRVNGVVRLDGTTIAGRAKARAGRYGSGLRCRQTTFGRDAWFSGSEFAGLADFGGARFRSDAGFGACQFRREAGFEGCGFGGTLGMESCVFGGQALFRGADFRAGAFFDGSSFTQEPAIDGASFARAPTLNGTRFPDGPVVWAADAVAPSPLRASGRVR